MTRGWAYGLLALLFLVSMIRGAAVPGIVSPLSSPAPWFMAGEVAPVSRTQDLGSQPATTLRPAALGKRETEMAGGDPSLLPTLLVVAIALFYALPLRGSDVIRALRIGLTPEGRHREAGRCPTGPPALA